MNIRLKERELELKKRLQHPYQWGQKQNDQTDRLTDFVYHIFTFDALLKELEARFRNTPRASELHQYALNRWYNFWSAKAVEQAFCSLPGVTATADGKDRLRDFSIGGTHFDHKTTIYPRGFNRDLEYGRAHPRELIEWLYKHQSQQRRKHLENRIFIVMYASDGQHWKLKAEINWLQTLIKEFVDGFSESTVHTFSFEHNTQTSAAIIWAVR